VSSLVPCHHEVDHSLI